MERAVLACDIGTSSLKAALVDSSGAVLVSARVRFPEARRSARDWTLALAEASACLRKCLAESGTGIPFDPVAIAISGNGPTLVSIDKTGETGPVLLWNELVAPGENESRPRTDSSPHSALSPRARHSGHGSSVAGEAPSSPSIFIPRILSYRAAFGSRYENARLLLSGPEYLIWALTGNAVTILPEARFERAYWTAGDLERGGLDGSRLAPFVPTGYVAGKASLSSLRAALGSTGAAPRTEAYPGLEAIPEGIPVIAGGPDFIVALIGTGTLNAGTACDRAGTSEGLNVCTAERIDRESVRTLPSVIGGLWNASYLLPETGAAFHAWRRDAGQNKRPYPEIMAEIEASPIIPAHGEPLHPGRAMVERIGFSVRRGVETLKAATGLDCAFTLSGGQARNETWNQMKADITGASFALTATPDGELMGDAVVAFASLGDYASIGEAAKRMVTVTRHFEPDAARYRQYTEKFLAHENL